MLSYFLEKFSRKGFIVVNCWFCNKDTRVPNGNKNCFDCPSCDQYNGFTQDGSYNKVIPAQRDEMLNHPVTAANQTPCASKYSSKLDSSLCQKCNNAQEAKIRKLASFSPSKPSRYDVEIEQYRKHLEQIYPLCLHCEDVVQRVLLQQKTSLLGLKNKLCGNKVSIVPPRHRPQHLRFLPVVLAAWLFLANVFEASGSSDEEPLLLWPLGQMLHVLPQAVLWPMAYCEALLSFTTVIMQAVILFSSGTMSLDSVGCLVLLLQLHLLCWLKAWYLDFFQYRTVQVITCVGILSQHFLRPLKYRRKYLSFGSVSKHVNNLQWHRMKSTAAVFGNGSKIDSIFQSYKIDQHKPYFESEPSSMHTDANVPVKTINTVGNTTPFDDLRTAMTNLQLGFTSTVTQSKPMSMFRLKEYGRNVDRHLFDGGSPQSWKHLKDSKFACYGNERGYKSSSPLLQRHSPGVRQVAGKWDKWRNSYEPLNLVEKPYISHSRSPSRSSGYASLASQSSIPESLPRITDYAGHVFPAPRWHSIGRVSSPECVTSAVDLAGRHISTQNLYLGSPYVYCVFPHVLYPVPPAVPIAPMWSVPTYPHNSSRASLLCDDSLSQDYGCGYLQCCEIAVYIIALMFLVYITTCCEQQLLLESS